MSHLNDNLIIEKSSLSSRRWWQKRAVTIGVAILGLLLVIIIMTVNVAKYETHLATGETVLLALAPVDPRGFMQGDYMTLSYALEQQVLDTLYDRLPEEDHRLETAEGYVIVRLDKHNVGRFMRLSDSNAKDNLSANERAIFYRIRNGSMKLATNAFFFQEGHAQSFEAAEYGLFRVNDKGEPLLTNMVDEKFEVIKGVNNEGSEGLENMGRQESGM